MSGRYGRIGFLPSEANERLVLADKEQMPEGNFCQVCPRIGSLRGEGLGQRPGAFLLRDFDTGFDAGTRIEGSPESFGLRPYRVRNGVLLQH